MNEVKKAFGGDEDGGIGNFYIIVIIICSWHIRGFSFRVFIYCIMQDTLLCHVACTLAIEATPMHTCLCTDRVCD